MSQTAVAPSHPSVPKSGLPAGVIASELWRETPGGPIVEHDHERPVDKTARMPTGVWWMCPNDECAVGEWVFATTDGAPGRPKAAGCPKHVAWLQPGHSEATDTDPKTAARARMRAALAARAARARQAAADAANARITAIHTAGKAEAARARRDLREHVPSAAVSAAALTADYAMLHEMQPLQTYATGICLASVGAVVTYLGVYVGEFVYARRMGYTMATLPHRHRRRARSHAVWIGSGLVATGVWLVIARSLGAELGTPAGAAMALIGALLVGLVNYRPWAAMVQRRQDEARAQEQAAADAAEAERLRLAEEAAARQRKRDEAEAERLRLAAEAEQAARKIVLAEDDTAVAGRKFAERWARIAEDAKARNMTGPGFEIWRTQIVVEGTRKLTASVAGETAVVGHEFLVRADPGVLAPRSGNETSPFVLMKPWLASMLGIETGMLDLAYQPQRVDASDKSGSDQRLINHGLVTLFDAHPLGEPVSHPGASGCYTDKNGTLYGFAGRDLRGNVRHRRLWTPGQAGGGFRVGVTGSGKSVITQITVYNDLLSGIFPIIHDAGKNAMDFVDFYGIIPVGHTKEHRDIIRRSLWAEMKRRQAWINTQTTIGLGGMEVTDDPTWDPKRGGPPIRVTWEEFHMHMKDPKFVAFIGELIRLQRATAIMGEGASQGSGLADWGDQNLKEQIAEIMTQLMRVSDHTARLAGYNGPIWPSSLPAMAGMMVEQDLRGEPVAYRSAFIPRDPRNPNSLIYRMRRPNGTPEGEQILFAPELPPETIEVFREHGLMDLWEKGMTKSGREQLQAEADPVESTVDPTPIGAALAGLAGGAPTGTGKPRMEAADVVLAMLKQDLDSDGEGLTQDQLQASTWWGGVEGKWSSTATGRPALSTVNRACQLLSLVTDEGAAAGDAALITNDGGKPAHFTLLAAGVDRAERELMRLRAAGVLGAQVQQQVRATGVDVAQLEREAMYDIEQQQMARDLIRRAYSATSAPAGE